MISAIIVAGGKGKRMGTDISKQFIAVNGKPILYYTLRKFLECKDIDNIILVLPKDEIEYCVKEILEKYSLKVNKIIEGGKERQESVYNGLKACVNSNIVLIHDGARPFVSKHIIQTGIRYAEVYGAAAPGVMPKDTIKIKNLEGFSIQTPNRENLVAVQTPQVFKWSIIMECHEKIKKDKIMVTDDTMVVEMYGNKVYLYEGDYSNIKVTTQEDLLIAEHLVKNSV